jgi:hypothetical protein
MASYYTIPGCCGSMSTRHTHQFVADLQHFFVLWTPDADDRAV